MKKKCTPEGPWQPHETGKPQIPIGDPKKLRRRAEELKLKAASLTNEADQLFARAELIESANKKSAEDLP